MPTALRDFFNTKSILLVLFNRLTKGLVARTDIRNCNITIKTLHVLHPKCCSDVKFELTTCNILRLYSEASGGKTHWQVLLFSSKGCVLLKKAQSAGVYSLNTLRSQCYFLVYRTPEKVRIYVFCCQQLLFSFETSEIAFLPLHSRRYMQEWLL